MASAASASACSSSRRRSVSASYRCDRKSAWTKWKADGFGGWGEILYLRPGTPVFRVPEELPTDVAVLTELMSVTHSLDLAARMPRPGGFRSGDCNLVTDGSVVFRSILSDQTCLSHHMTSASCGTI